MYHHYAGHHVEFQAPWRAGAIIANPEQGNSSDAGAIMTICGRAIFNTTQPLRWVFIMLWAITATQAAYSETNNINNSAIPASSFLHNFVNVELVDQHGNGFQPEQLQNHVVLFNFIFTACHSACPIQTRSLVQVKNALAKNVNHQIRFVSVSIDPRNDSPEQLRSFANAMEANLDGWIFLTGQPNQLKALAKKLHIFDEQSPSAKPQVHRTSLWLVDKQGRMLQRYKGDPPDQQRLIRELTQVTQLNLAHTSIID